MGIKFTPHHITPGEDELIVFGAPADSEDVDYGTHEREYIVPVTKGNMNALRSSIDDFLTLAWEWDQNIFYVTDTGWSESGLRKDDVALLFAKGLDLYNVRLPESFAKAIIRQEYSYLSEWQEIYSSYDMMIDLLLSSIRIFHYQIEDLEYMLELVREKIEGSASRIPFITPYLRVADHGISKAVGQMEICGLLMTPIQRFGLILESAIARKIREKHLSERDSDEKERDILKSICLEYDNRSLAERLRRAFTPIENFIRSHRCDLCVNGFLSDQKLLEALTSPTLREQWLATVNLQEIIDRHI